VAQEFLPLRRVLGLVQAEIRAAGADLAEQRGDVAFVLGECTLALSLELTTDGKETMARFPSFVEGEALPPEQLSRITLTLRSGLSVEER
jgi:hypothetical protein